MRIMNPINNKWRSRQETQSIKPPISLKPISCIPWTSTSLQGRDRVPEHPSYADYSGA